MSRWVLVLAVMVASATASADPRPVIQPLAATVSAETATKAAERQVVQLTGSHAALEQRYQDQLAQIDRLKNQRASWRRDRELRASLSESLETANLLSAATRDLEKAKASLESARRAYLLAIDTELGAGAAPARVQVLVRAKAQLVPQIKDVPRRIVIPDFAVDPLADPEELDQRAAELHAAEIDLGRQLAGLKAQAAELDHLVVLRKQHDRAGEVFNRDDDEPRRNTTGRPSTEPGSDEGGGTAGGRPNVGPGTSSPSFENFVPIVLADVIDASTINSLEAAQRSGDPAQRAEASHLAGDAVARRLAEIKKHRLEIEERARSLRAKH
ncbi:MAG TPA: hypothetical protein VIX73_04020 [Kofleriaceae bacterium]